MPLVTPQGFQPIPETIFAGLDAISGANAVDLPNDVDANAFAPQLRDVPLVRIPFPKSDDGRGFSLARRLRDLGYRGRLRAHGHVISDQFRYALECGFDEVEISDDLAARQPEAHWRADRAPSYRNLIAGRREYPAPAGVHTEVVTEVTHYTDRLFRFRISRPDSFRFRSGEFVMIGLPNAEKPIFRAYSIASPSWDQELEFYSIKVPDGPLTAHLQRIRPGDRILLRKKATGTLVNDALLPGQRLYLFSTGTGIAPFASVIRDPETYERFDQVILTHTCRDTAELAYGHELVANTMADPLVGEDASEKLVHFTTTTRQTSPTMGRITDLIANGGLADHLGVPPLDPTVDRAMICGSAAMLKDTKALLEKAGLTEGANNKPGEFVVERAFVD